MVEESCASVLGGEGGRFICAPRGRVQTKQDRHSALTRPQVRHVRQSGAESR